MQKSLIFLTFGALGVITTLFYLPKGIVRDKNKVVESVTRSANRDAKSDIKEDGPHQEVLSPEQKNHYKLLVSALSNAQNNADKIKYLDSLASFFSSLNRPDSASTYYEKIAIIMNDSKSFKKAGDIYYEAFRLALNSERAKKYGEKTRQFYQMVLKENPDELDIKSKMAMTYVTTSTPMQGIVLLREVIAKDPGNVPALMNLGLLSMQSRQFDKAIERFNQIIIKHAGNTEARLYLAVSYAEAGKNEEAIKEFNFLKLNENDPVIIQTVDQYLQKLNQK